MIFKFSNLGAIKEAELDLRPLTVIIGPNNSNKTYLAYSLYGLLKNVDEISNVIIPEMNIRNKSSYHIEIPMAHLLSAITNQLRYVENEFKEKIGSFFQDNTQKIFSKTKIKSYVSELELLEACKNLATLGNGFSFKVQVNTSVENLLLDIIPENETDRDNFKLISSIQKFHKGIYRRLERSLCPQPFLLPAERTALIIVYKLLANRRYKLLLEEQKSLRKLLRQNNHDSERQFEILKEQGDIIYPQPIEDFLEFLADIELKINDRDETNHQFQRLAKQIETNIQNNNFTLWKRTRFGGQELRVHIKHRLDIDLYNASSSIKQLAPLLLYLRYRAQENDLLIIDEPEMNLHPESQARLLEALAILVNLGVKVLLTTHSPYFMAHLNNLVSGSPTNKSALKRQADALYLKDERAFLHMDKVSAYQMKAYKNEFKLESLKDPDYGIRWDTLSDVSAEIQQKYFEIHEKGKAPSRVGQKRKTTGKKQKSKS